MAHVTIPDQDSYVTYSSQTGTGPFTVPFAVFEKADLTVLVAGVDIGQAGFSYTATSSTTGGYQTGTITLATSIVSKDVTIYRRINPKRTTDLGVGPQNRDALNSAFDRIHAQLQDNQRDLDRSYKGDFGTALDEDVADAVQAVAAIASDVELVADIDAEVVIVADAIEDVETVAAAIGGVTDLAVAVTAAEAAQAAAEAARDLAQTHKTAAQLAETNAETAETNAETAETAAELARAGAEAARDAALYGKGVFPSTAAGIGFGVASYASLVGGSGGTNGTFDLAFSGGTGSGAAGRFTVAGGALVSITLTAPGSYTVVPSFSFAASSGLTGASATAVLGRNADVGEYFSVPDTADPMRMTLYRVDSGPAATAIMNFYSAEAMDDIVYDLVCEPVRAAFDQAGDLRALWLHKGPVTPYSGSASIITAWESLDAGAKSLGLYGTLFSGADPRPIINADRGMYFNAEAGLQISDGILANTNKCAIMFCFDMDPANHVDFVDKATMDADAGSHLNGTIARVTSDVNTTYTPDFDLLLGGDYTNDVTVNGYWSRNFAGWATSAGTNPIFLWSLTGTGGSYIRAGINRLGQLRIDTYAGSGSPYAVRTIYNPVMGVAGPQLAMLTRDATHLRLWLNGVEVMAVEAPFANITDFTTLYINGNARLANAALPVLGWRHYLKAWGAVSDWTWTELRQAHDALAHYCGTPRLDIPEQAWGVMHAGQSWWQGSTTISDLWTGAGGWDGAVDRVNATRSGEHISITREFLPHVFSTRDQDNNDDIGPLAVALNGFGNMETGNSHAPSNNNLAFGMFKHLLNDDAAPHVDWTIASAGAGGNTLANLSSETSPAPLVQALKSKASSAITYYEELLQAVVNARDFHAARGQRYSVKAFLWQQGHSDVLNASYVTDFLAYYDKLNAAVKRITGQSDDVACFMPQINYSSDGTSNGWLAIDQRILDIVDGRGTRPIYCLGPVYQITSFIHSYPGGYRWQGELFGKVMKRVLFDGVDWQPVRPHTFTRGANYVDIDFYVPSGSLQFVDTNENNIAARVNVGGVDTYGFEFTDTSGGGVVITSVTIQDANTVRINLSGAPAATDVVKYVGATCRYGNLCDQDAEVAYYRDQDWGAAFTSGSPTYAEDSLYDLRNWACAFSQVLT